MDGFDWSLKMILALVLGALIGLEREINERKNIKGDTVRERAALLGLRSFSLISGLGALVGLLYSEFPIISAIIASAFAILMIAFYFMDSKFTKDIGITTEVSVFYSFIIGFLLSVGTLPVQVVIALTVVLVLLMSRKSTIKDFIGGIHHTEINALISFALLAFVILPFLPNESYSLADINGTKDFFQKVGWNVDKVINLDLFNPFKLWFIAVLITGVDLLGYILERTVGKKKGWLITSLVGGFVSSTATTISIAQESKHTKATNALLSGAIFANLISFFPIALLLITMNIDLFISFFPILLSLIIAALVVGLYFFIFAKDKSSKVADEKKIQDSHKIFDLVSALKFVGIYLIINIVSKVALEFLGSTGFLITTGVGALTGVDAVVINTAQLAGNRIDMTLAVWSLILANSVNLIAKSIYSFLQGSKEFAVKFLMSMLIIIAASLVSTLVFLIL